MVAMQKHFFTSVFLRILCTPGHWEGLCIVLCDPQSPKVTLGSPIRLQALSRQLSAAFCGAGDLFYLALPDLRSVIRKELPTAFCFPHDHGSDRFISYCAQTLYKSFQEVNDISIVYKGDYYG